MFFASKSHPVSLQTEQKTHDRHRNQGFIETVTRAICGDPQRIFRWSSCSKLDQLLPSQVTCEKTTPVADIFNEAFRLVLLTHRASIGLVYIYLHLP